MEDTSSTQDHTGHIRTCSGYPRGSGQFLTWNKTHHTTPQIISEFDNKINGSQNEYPGPHLPHPDMFRVPPGKWPVSDLDPNPSCDTSNHMRIKKYDHWWPYQTSRTTLATPGHVPGTPGEVASF